MIHFPRLRTSRMDIQLRELQIGEELELAALPLGQHEATTSALLAKIVADASPTTPAAGRLTVQERTMIVVHYMACTRPDERDFQIGDDGTVSDYIMGEVDSAPHMVNAGEAAGSVWTCRQVLGGEAEAIERLCQDRSDWVFADMAARLREVGQADDAPDAISSPLPYSEWLKRRVEVFKAMPTSDFTAVCEVYSAALDELAHLFVLDCDNEGYLALPVRKGAGGEDLPPARFSAAAALSAIAHLLVARQGGGRGGDGPGEGQHELPRRLEADAKPD
jgi:hypothetical protein